MATLYDTDTLLPVEIPDADAPTHVLSGRYGLEGGKRVALYRPDGTMVTMGTEDAPSAFQDGYTYAPQTELRAKEIEDKYGVIGSKLLAGGAGVARGLTFGLSDRALRNVGVEAKTLRDLEEGAPYTSGVGEAVGTIAPLVLSGGTGAAVKGASLAGPSLLAKGATAVGKRAVGAIGLEGATSILGRAGAKAVELGVGGAIEGAAYGAGHAISEDALGRADLNAESLIANVGLGAAIGGTAGGVLGGFSSLVGSGSKRLAGALEEKFSGSLVGQLDEIANESAVKATGARGSDIQKLGTAAKIKQIGEDLRGYTLEDGRKLLEFADDAEGLLAKLHVARQEATSGLGGFRKQVDGFVRANPDEAFDVGEYLSRVRKEVLEPLAESGVPSVRAKGKQVLRELAPTQKAWEAGREFSPKTLTKLRQDLADVVYPKRPPGGGLPPQPPAHAAELMKAERILEGFIEENTERVVQKMNPEMAGEYARLRRLSESFIKAEKLADKAAKQNLGNRSISLTDYLAGLGGAATGGVGGMALAAGAALVNKVLRERGRSAVAVIADKATRLQAIQRASVAVEKRLDKAITGLVSRQPGLRMATQAPHVTQALLGMAFAPMHASETKDRKGAAKQRSRELARLITDPKYMADRISISLHGVEEAAPAISGQVALTAAKAVQFLHARAPKDPGGTSTLQPLLDDWEPNDQEVATFERYVRAALNPLSVLDDLEAGSLTKEGVETMRELYPQLHEMTLRKITERLAEKKDKLPYSDRINLSLLFGVPTDDTVRPGFIARTQAMWRAQPKQEAGGQSTGNVASLGLGENMRSDAQRLEEKR